MRCTNHLSPSGGASVDALNHSSAPLLVGRKRPDRAWFDLGLDHVSSEISLGPLGSDEATELLRRQGIAEPDEQARIRGWARGFPIALTLAASIRHDPSDAREPTPWHLED